MRAFAWLTAVFLFTFGWKVTEVLDLIPLVSVGAVLVLVVSRSRIQRPGLPMLSLAILALATGYAIAVTVLTGALNPEMTLRLLRAAVNLAGGIALALLLRPSGEHATTRLVRLLVGATTFHAVLLVAMYLSPDLRHLVYSITRPERIVNLNTPFLEGLRVTGLTYGLAQTSVVHAIGGLLAFWPGALTGRQPRFVSTALTMTVVALNLGAIAVTGRTGLVIFLVFAPLVVVSRLYSSRSRRWSRVVPLRARRRPAVLHLALVAVVVPTVLLASVVATRQLDAAAARLAYTLSHQREAVAFLVTPTETGFGRAALGWLGVAGRMDDRMVLGLGTLSRRQTGLVTDSGWLRYVADIGIVGTVLVTASFLVLLFAALRGTGPRVLSTESLIVLLVFAATLVLNAKEVALMTRNQWSLQVLLAATLAYHGLPPRAQVRSRWPVDRSACVATPGNQAHDQASEQNPDRAGHP